MCKDNELEWLVSCLGYNVSNVRTFLCEVGIAAPETDDELLSRKDSLLKIALKKVDLSYIKEIISKI